MSELCKAEYEVRLDLSTAFDAARRPGHVRADLCHSVLTSAVRAWRNGATLPPAPRRGAVTGVEVATWRITCRVDERRELNQRLRAAGSSGRAVLEVFAQAYIDADGDMLAIQLPWEVAAARELARAS